MGFVVQEPSSGAAFPSGRITCLPGITQQHLTALIHPPRDCGTRVPRWFVIFEGTFSFMSSRRSRRAAEREPGSSVAFRWPWCFTPSRFKSSASSSSSQATKITETCKAISSSAAKLGLSFVLQPLVCYPGLPLLKPLKGRRKTWLD